MHEDQVFSKRSRLEIVYTILSLCNRIPYPKKTHVMYKCNLSFKQLDMYLKFLTTLGFLTVGENELYQTTDKGQEFVKQYQRIQTLIDLSRLG